MTRRVGRKRTVYASLGLRISASPAGSGCFRSRRRAHATVGCQRAIAMIDIINCLSRRADPGRSLQPAAHWRRRHIQSCVLSISKHIVTLCTCSTRICKATSLCERGANITIVCSAFHLCYPASTANDQTTLLLHETFRHLFYSISLFSCSGSPGFVPRHRTVADYCSRPCFAATRFAHRGRRDFSAPQTWNIYVIR